MRQEKNRAGHDSIHWELVGLWKVANWF